MTQTVSYTNKKGKAVNVIVTKHARERFKTRYNNLFGIKLDEDATNNFLELVAKRAEIQSADTKHLQRRSKKRDTLYLLSRLNDASFRLVVACGKVITIELAGKNRGFNNKSMFAA